ncbi:MAG: YdjY domain-containing protein, partial [Planctomycetota bacterium]
MTNCPLRLIASPAAVDEKPRAATWPIGWWFVVAVLLSTPCVAQPLGDTPADAEAQASQAGDAEATEPKPPAPLPPPADAVRVNPRAPVWVNREKRLVMVDGVVSLRRGLLEMFACPRGTKEHESVVAVSSPAFVVHAGLLAVGAQPGKPVQWDPEYVPPSGDEIAITVEWRKDGRDDGPIQSVDAREWVRDLRDGKAMRETWVFAGSGFWKDEETGREYY